MSLCSALPALGLALWASQDLPQLLRPALPPALSFPPLLLSSLPGPTCSPAPNSHSLPASHALQSQHGLQVLHSWDL